MAKSTPLDPWFVLYEGTTGEAQLLPPASDVTG